MSRHTPSYTCSAREYVFFFLFFFSSCASPAARGRSKKFISPLGRRHRNVFALSGLAVGFPPGFARGKKRMIYERPDTICPAAVDYDSDAPPPPTGLDHDGMCRSKSLVFPLTLIAFVVPTRLSRFVRHLIEAGRCRVEKTDVKLKTRRVAFFRLVIFDLTSLIFFFHYMPLLFGQNITRPR